MLIITLRCEKWKRLSRGPSGIHSGLRAALRAGLAAVPEGFSKGSARPCLEPVNLMKLTFAPCNFRFGKARISVNCRFRRRDKPSHPPFFLSAAAPELAREEQLATRTAKLKCHGCCERRFPELSGRLNDRSRGAIILADEILCFKFRLDLQRSPVPSRQKHTIFSILSSSHDRFSPTSKTIT